MCAAVARYGHSNVDINCYYSECQLEARSVPGARLECRKMRLRI